MSTCMSTCMQFAALLGASPRPRAALKISCTTTIPLQILTKVAHRGVLRSNVPRFNVVLPAWHHTCTCTMLVCTVYIRYSVLRRDPLHSTCKSPSSSARLARASSRAQAVRMHPRQPLRSAGARALVTPPGKPEAHLCHALAHRALLQPLRAEIRRYHPHWAIHRAR